MRTKNYAYTYSAVKPEDVMTLSRKGYDKFKYVSDGFIERNGGRRHPRDDGDDVYNSDGDSNRWRKLHVRKESNRMRKMRKKLTREDHDEGTFVENRRVRYVDKDKVMSKRKKKEGRT